ncbi:MULTISPECIES: TetR/AcrR family transcriptional regulator [Micromonospora]|uniref:TetR/AcrR family transcriptional regulator n=1 Tax=Micromonospora TaxID=1873 RepID=UPI0018907442|nr:MULTISPECIES: TetR/AcrR family transcriptional regulator [unclassified Micromonospora]MBF5033606.1 TetR/AcrR family transcriptional regulator [Micromonospora sp. ANENR4]MCZ7476460.1 TetR/AcrR family transcriptional regulator [Micromonospora sp. WMMC273]WBC01293.1 TetR/AcrR family transcriptional regulator [Micromonospora sp. WMMA1976]
MPKVVDHEERRRHLGAAACVVLARAGSAGMTVRAVAAEAGMPLATAQHYLPTRELMVRAAMDHLAGRVVARARTIPADPVTPEVIRQAVRQLVPLDAERAFEARVWLVLTAEALVDEQVAAILAESEAQMRANVERLLTLGRATGGIAGHVDARAEAAALATLLDGVTVRILTTGLDPADARTEIDAHLARLAPAGA